MRALTVAYLVLIHLAVAALAWNHVRSPAAREAADRAAAIANGLKRAAQAPTAIAIVGDSRVADLAVSTVAPQAEGYGIGSEPLEQVRGRLALYDFRRARAVVIESGIKEWHERRFEGFAARYRAALAVTPPGVPVVAMALIPLDERRAGARWQGVNAALPDANAAIKAACRARPGCTYAPQPFGRTLAPRYHVGDGIHLSPQGSAMMAASLRTALGRYAV